MNNIPDCECGENNWFNIPDSLAVACDNCGRVLVEAENGGWKKGASIQKWLNDTYGTELEDPDEETDIDEH